MRTPDIPSATIDTAGITASSRVANAIASKLGSREVKQIQRLQGTVALAADLLGLGDNTNVPQPLLGGITLAEARAMYSAISNTRFARKALWFVEIEDPNPPALLIPAKRQPGQPVAGGSEAAMARALRTNPLLGVRDAASTARRILGSPSGSQGSTRDQPDVAHCLNLFATAVTYTANTIEGDKGRVGGATVDMLTGAGPVELTLTTRDDEVGTLKRWFEAKAEQAVSVDGSFGVPIDYCVTIRVVHATPKAHPRAYTATYMMRPASLSHELARGDSGFEELTMSWAQADSFVPVR